MDNAERLIKKVFIDCATCDCCRHTMDTSCLFFPEVYKLWDREQDTGEPITSKELRELTDLCNYCALCPCPDIREDIITAKTMYIDQDGLDPRIRLLEDVEQIGRLCGAFPGLSNFLLQNKISGSIIKKMAGINGKRNLPEFPEKSFPALIKSQGLNETATAASEIKVAYFAGCTAQYLFPDVPLAVTEVFQRHNIPVFYPEQHCCGMPAMLEGDRKLTLELSERTISQLSEVVADGYDIVCSCSTCGFMLKNTLLEGAYYSDQYQEFAGGDEKHMIVPQKTSFGDKIQTTPDSGKQLNKDPQILNKTLFKKVLKDDGYFSGIDPMKRIQVAESTYDLGEYLLALHKKQKINFTFNPFPGNLLYYPPCHQREQNIGTPYMDLMGLIPGISLSSFPSTFYCCGIAGIMGFKQDFHKQSIQMGSRLFARIKELDPESLVTDCLSCRLQFHQMGSSQVLHPIEVINNACR